MERSGTPEKNLHATWQRGGVREAFLARQARFSPGFPMISSEVSENVSPCHVFDRFFPVQALISRILRAAAGAP